MAAAVSDLVIPGRSGDLESYLVADKVFQRALLEASGNEMFRALHDEVARAIRMRDEDAAEQAMRAIIDEATEAVAPESDPDSRAVSRRPD